MVIARVGDVERRPAVDPDEVDDRTAEQARALAPCGR